MRLFLAIDLQEKVKKSLSKQIDDLKKKYPDFSWVDEKNFHITIHFFGEVKDIEKIQEKIKTAIYDQYHFYLYSYDLGMFVNHKITVYLGFRREKKLENLVNSIRDIFNIDNPIKFVPHLTLARYRIPSKQQYFVIKKNLSQQNIEIDFSVKKIILFQSILSAKKPIYKKLASFSLV